VAGLDVAQDGDPRGLGSPSDNLPEQLSIVGAVVLRAGDEERRGGVENAQLLQIGQVTVDVCRRRSLLGRLEQEDLPVGIGPCGRALEMPANRLARSTRCGQRPTAPELGDTTATVSPGRTRRGFVSASNR